MRRFLGSVSGVWGIPRTRTSGRFGATGLRLRPLAGGAVAGGYEIGLLSRVTRRDGEAVALWRTRDAVVLKALATGLARRLLVSAQCDHLAGHGGAKAAVRAALEQVSAHSFVMWAISLASMVWALRPRWMDEKRGLTYFTKPLFSTPFPTMERCGQRCPKKVEKLKHKSVPFFTDPDFSLDFDAHIGLGYDGDGMSWCK